MDKQDTRRNANKRSGNRPSKERVSIGSEIQTSCGRLWIVVQDLSYVPGHTHHASRAVRAAPVIGDKILWRSAKFIDGVFETTGRTVDIPEPKQQNTEVYGSQSIMRLLL